MDRRDTEMKFPPHRWIHLSSEETVDAHKSECRSYLIVEYDEYLSLQEHTHLVKIAELRTRLKELEAYNDYCACGFGCASSRSSHIQQVQAELSALEGEK